LRSKTLCSVTALRVNLSDKSQIIIEPVGSQCLKMDIHKIMIWSLAKMKLRLDSYASYPMI